MCVSWNSGLWTGNWWLDIVVIIWGRFILCCWFWNVISCPAGWYWRSWKLETSTFMPSLQLAKWLPPAYYFSISTHFVASVISHVPPLLPLEGCVTASGIMSAILFLSSPSKHATRRCWNTSLNYRCWRYLKKKIASWLTVVVAVSGNERGMLWQRLAVSIWNMNCDGDETKKCVYSRTPLIRTLAILVTNYPDRLWSFR